MINKKIQIGIALLAIVALSFFVKNSEKNLVFAEDNIRNPRKIVFSPTSPKLWETVSISIKNSGEVISGTVSLITPDIFDFLIIPGSGNEIPNTISYSGSNLIIYNWIFSGQQTGINLIRSGVVKKIPENNFSIQTEIFRGSGKIWKQSLPFSIQKSAVQPFIIYETWTGTTPEIRAILSWYDSATQTIFNNNRSPIKILTDEKVFFFQLLDQNGNLSLIAAQTTGIKTPSQPEKASIRYSTTKPTNQPVLATFSLTGSTILNNSGSFIHSFPSNGTFSFIYKDQYGNTGSETVTVNRIDTKPIKATITQTPIKRTTNPVSITIHLSKPWTISYKKNFYSALSKSWKSNPSITLPPIRTNETSDITFFDEAGNSGKIQLIVANIIDPNNQFIGFPNSLIGLPSLIHQNQEKEKPVEKIEEKIIEEKIQQVINEKPTKETKTVRICNRSFEDIENSFYRKQIMILAQYCIVQGRSQTAYKPNNFVRAQDFIKMITNSDIVKKIGYLPEKIDYNKNISTQLLLQQTTKDLGIKATTEITVDQAKKIIEIFKKQQPENEIIEIQTLLAPSNRITKAQAADLIVRAFQLQEPDLSIQ